MRTRDEICDEISRMTPEESGRLIARIQAKDDWSDERKDATVQFIMLLGLIGDRSLKRPT